MKALPLWQPWASLVAINAKRIETRKWAPPVKLIGQRIAIHATKTDGHMLLAGGGHFRAALDHARATGGLRLVSGRLPFGALIATVVITECREITKPLADALAACHPAEYAFGDYDLSAGPRYAWYLNYVDSFDPVPFTGRQGMFNVPDELVGGAP